MTEQELDLCTLALRLQQVRSNTDIYGAWTLLDLVLDRDLPRLLKHLAPEAIEEARRVLREDFLLDVCDHARWCGICGRCSACGADLPLDVDVTRIAHEELENQDSEDSVSRETVPDWPEECVTCGHQELRHGVRSWPVMKRYCAEGGCTCETDLAGEPL
jgi:hypothetical protein